MTSNQPISTCRVSGEDLQYNIYHGYGSGDTFKLVEWLASVAMFRAILPDGDLTAERYEERDHGIELFTETDELLAFVPYPNLVALVNESIERKNERSIM